MYTYFVVEMDIMEAVEGYKKIVKEHRRNTPQSLRSVSSLSS